MVNGDIINEKFYFFLIRGYVGFICIFYGWFFRYVFIICYRCIDVCYGVIVLFIS